MSWRCFYEEQEIDIFMDDLGVCDDEIDYSDPRWSTPLGMEVQVPHQTKIGTVGLLILFFPRHLKNNNSDMRKMKSSHSRWVFLAY